VRETSAGVGSFLIETLQAIRVVVTSNAQSRETPPKKWYTYKYISYRDLHGAFVKFGLTSKDVGLEQIKTQTHKALLWTDTTGVETYIACDDSEFTNGRHYHQRVLQRTIRHRENTFSTALGGFSLEIQRDKKGAILKRDYRQFDPATGHFRKVHSVEDTTGCDNAEFPFQLLKEKPLYLPDSSAKSTGGLKTRARRRVDQPSRSPRHRASIRLAQ